MHIQNFGRLVTYIKEYHEMRERMDRKAERLTRDYTQISKWMLTMRNKLKMSVDAVVKEGHECYDVGIIYGNEKDKLVAVMLKSIHANI